MTSLEQTLVAVARFLRTKKIPYMVIGGAANLFWGVPRTTLDVDVTVQVQEDRLSALVDEIKKCFQSRVKDTQSFVAKMSVLPLQDASGIRIDLIFARLPYEFRAIRRAKTKRVAGESVRICSPEDLIIHKIISDRPRDQEDVRGIIERVGPALDRKYLDPAVKDLAREFAKPGIFDFYLRCFDRK